MEERISLPMLQNSLWESWNEVNPMPTHMHDFGHLWTNMANVSDGHCLGTSELPP